MSFLVSTTTVKITTLFTSQAEKGTEEIIEQGKRNKISAITNLEFLCSRPGFQKNASRYIPLVQMLKYSSLNPECNENCETYSHSPKNIHKILLKTKRETQTTSSSPKKNVIFNFIMCLINSLFAIIFVHTVCNERPKWFQKLSLTD